MITKAKDGGVHSRRMLSSYLFSNLACDVAVKKYAPRFKERNGGYTRIIKHGMRFGDGAQMASIELVDYRENEGLSAGSKK